MSDWRASRSVLRAGLLQGSAFPAAGSNGPETGSAGSAGAAGAAFIPPFAHLLQRGGWRAAARLPRVRAGGRVPSFDSVPRKRRQITGGENAMFAVEWAG